VKTISDLRFRLTVRCLLARCPQASTQTGISDGRRLRGTAIEFLLPMIAVAIPAGLVAGDLLMGRPSKAKGKGVS
jgi:hypothetical protein